MMHEGRQPASGRVTLASTSETTVVATLNPPGRTRIGTVGLP